MDAYPGRACILRYTLFKSCKSIVAIRSPIKIQKDEGAMVVVVAIVDGLSVHE